VLAPLTAKWVEQLVDAGARVVDGRPPRDFMHGHLPGSINVPVVGGSVGTRAAAVVDPEADVVTIGSDDAEARDVALLLQATGFGSVRGYLDGGAFAWQASGRPLRQIPAIGVDELRRLVRSRSVEVLDVRERWEWEAGHVPGSINVPYHELGAGIPPEVEEVADRRLAVVCSAGNRSSLAASLLARSRPSLRLFHSAGGVAELARARKLTTSG
jgi:rhodanese-related sulfurtransferase